MYPDARTKRHKYPQNGETSMAKKESGVRFWKIIIVAVVARNGEKGAPVNNSVDGKELF